MVKTFLMGKSTISMAVFSIANYMINYKCLFTRGYKTHDINVDRERIIRIAREIARETGPAQEICGELSGHALHLA